MEVLTKNIRFYKGDVRLLIQSDQRKIGLFLTHLGLGDMINMNGAIHYLTTFVDVMYVVCKNRNSKNVSQMLSCEPKIKLIVLETDPERSSEGYKRMIEHIQYVPEKYMLFNFFSGYWSNRTDYNDIPGVFYDDLKLDRSIRTSHFKLNIQTKLPVPEIPYFFVHSSTSFGKSNLHYNFNKDTTLIVDPNTNHYPIDHKWHSIAEYYIDKPIFEYVDVIENADEIHVTDSAFYCLACYLKLKANTKKCYNRETGEVNPVYTFQ